MPAAFPEHFHIAEMLQQDEAGLVPYADVAFDVGPDTGGNAAGRFLAHRIIVSSVSPVLMDELAKIQLTLLPQEGVNAAVFRVDPRISKEVWRCALQFMYTGVITVNFTNDAQKIVELFRACVAYQLPRPLLDFAQTCLYPLLPGSPPEVALQVFSICAGSVAEDMDLTSAREASTYIVLRSAHMLFESMEASSLCQLLEKVVQSVEKVVFNPAAQAAAEAAAQQVAAQQAAQAAAIKQQAEAHQAAQMAAEKAVAQQAAEIAAQQAAAGMQGAHGGYGMPYQDMLAQSMPPNMTGGMQDPRMQDPRMQDMLSQSMPPNMMAGMQDPRMQDPRMQDMLSQSMQDPRTQDPRMQDPRMQDPMYAQAMAQQYAQAQQYERYLQAQAQHAQQLGIQSVPTAHSPAAQASMMEGAVYDRGRQFGGYG